jgi:uncharacterized protein YegP (UPF0339 family)
MLRAEVFQGRRILRQSWRFRILAVNNRIVASSEAYTNREDAWGTAAQLVGENNVKVVDR